MIELVGIPSILVYFVTFAGIFGLLTLGHVDRDDHYLLVIRAQLNRGGVDGGRQTIRAAGR